MTETDRLRRGLRGRAPSRPVALVTSGHGPTFGGIGVVSQAIHAILRHHGGVRLWRYEQSGHSIARAAGLVARSLSEVAFHRPAFVLYDHVHLSQIHVVSPWLRSVPYGIFLHGSEVWMPAAAIRRRALTNADILFANSQYTATHAREWTPGLPPIHVTWLGVDAPSPIPPVHERPPRAVLVGRMATNEAKGHDVILDAWPTIRAEVPDAELVLVGSGDDERRLRARGESMPGVRFLGFVPDEVRDELYRSARLFLLPNRQEGFGLASVEAAINGVALVGVRGTVMEELFAEGQAYFADETAPAAFTAAVLPLMRDAALAACVGRAGQIRALRTYTTRHFADRFSQVLVASGLIGSAPVAASVPA
jgi:phosphatidyl-myo-inositol dimannoside synthase